MDRKTLSPRLDVERAKERLRAAAAHSSAPLELPLALIRRSPWTAIGLAALAGMALGASPALRRELSRALRSRV
jgi:hypothetical protein